MDKKCRSCKASKNINQFDPDRLGKYGVGTTCKECKKQKIMADYKPLQSLKPVKKVGKRTTDRIKEKGSEAKIYIEIWKTRNHFCQNCKQEINFFDPSCFAHILPKGRYDKWRYDANNIALVHSVMSVKNKETMETYTCHQEIDGKMKYKKLEFEKLLEIGDQDQIKKFIENL